MVSLFALKGYAAEQAPKCIRKFSELDETEAYSVIDSSTAEQKKKKPAPEHTIDCIDYLTEKFHGMSLTDCEVSGALQVMHCRSQIQKKSKPISLL
jgi:hypothetical protein